MFVGGNQDVLTDYLRLTDFLVTNRTVFQDEAHFFLRVVISKHIRPVRRPLLGDARVVTIQVSRVKRALDRLEPGYTGPRVLGSQPGRGWFVPMSLGVRPAAAAPSTGC